MMPRRRLTLADTACPRPVAAGGHRARRRRPAAPSEPGPTPGAAPDPAGRNTAGVPGAHRDHAPPPAGPPSTRLLRDLALTRLVTAAVADDVRGRVRRRRGADPEVVLRELRARNADRTRATLGELKGGALKAGQLLATVQALLPADPDAVWADALDALVADAGAVGFGELAGVLREDLGPHWRTLFRSFDEEAVAAASLGQVHRARWSDGRDVAVKIQYPGVARALAGDLRAVSTATRLVGLVARGLALPPLVAELRTRLAAELDYRREASSQTAFARSYDGHPDVAVPAVVHGTGRVLVGEWLPGRPLAAVARSGSQELRDRVGELFQRFLLSGPARVGLLYTDPHPGNVRVLDDGRLGVLDFGSTLALPGGMPPTFGRLLRALLAGDPAAVGERLRADGLLDPTSAVDLVRLTDYLAPFTVPAAHDRWTYSPEWLHEQFGRLGDPRDPDFAVALRLRLPPEHLFTQRVWLAVVGVLCQLRATVPVAPELARWLPGFAPVASGAGPRPTRP